MYSYRYDIETGGILLGNDIAQMSNEPRPVYASELELLGMDKYWHFDNQDARPYLWAEANNYIYRGIKFARAKGGSLSEDPVLEILYNKADDAEQRPLLPFGETLIPVDLDAMITRNRDVLDILEQMTVKKIYDYYRRYKSKLDCFHVAFSGGKDSIVLLELVKKSITTKRLYRCLW